MMNEREPRAAASPFGNISESDRQAALEILGRFLIETRDDAVIQWEQILAGARKYAAWERLLARFPDMSDRMRQLVADVLPHIVDTFMYCLLADLEHSRTVRISVNLKEKSVEDVARLSWGLPAEPSGESGWLRKFSKQRFEQPY